MAASAYATLQSIAANVRRVVLLGPAHRMLIRGLALPEAEVFETPLGRINLDIAGMEAIKPIPQVIVSNQAHALEHSLEVQLPFLQCLLPDFSLLPLLVGHTYDEVVAEVLETVWDGDETLIVISSDFSHHLPYALAQQVDNETVDAILSLHAPLDPDRACGSIPVDGLILAAQKHHLSPHLLDLRNSGDTAGAHDQVVGYAAIAFTEAHEHAN